MNNALGAFDALYYYPLGNTCPVVQPLLRIGDIRTLGRQSFGRCGPGVQESSCRECCSRDGYHTSDVSTSYTTQCLYEMGLACDGTKWPPGFNTSETPRPQLGSVRYGLRIDHCVVPDSIALTYDDGVSKYTSDLLDILKANDVKATFFLRTMTLYGDLVFHQSDGLPAVVKRMYDEGHQVAGHTWEHLDLDTITSRQRKLDMTKQEMALTDILGFFPTYMRAPFMKCSAACQADMLKLGYHISGTDVDGRDWEGNYTYARQLFTKKITERTHSRIVLNHDTHNRTVHEHTQWMIDQAKAHGYRLLTLGECLGDPEENWYRDPLSGGPAQLPAKKPA